MKCLEMPRQVFLWKSNNNSHLSSADLTERVLGVNGKLIITKSTPVCGLHVINGKIILNKWNNRNKHWDGRLHQTN